MSMDATWMTGTEAGRDGLMPLFCAVSDVGPWMIGLGVLNLLVTVCLAVWMQMISSRTREIQTLKGNLVETARELVEVQIGKTAAELNTSIRVLSAELGEINRRLQRGDHKFDNMGNLERDVRIKLAEEVQRLREWVLENAATKEELRELKNSTVGE